MTNYDKLKEIAAKVRKTVLEVCNHANGGHVGSSLSAVELLTYLYAERLDINKDNVYSSDRDHFILSKGHAGLALCALFAELGYIEREKLDDFNSFDSDVSIHLDERKIPFVDVSTGSLGHGEGIALGIALGNRINRCNKKVYCLLGDGELNEGSTFEAFSAVNAFNANNLVTIIDNNGFMLDGKASDVFPFKPISEKLEALGFSVIPCDGHDFVDIERAFDEAEMSNRPCAILAKTVKGKGVSFIENNVDWHYGAPTDEELKKAKEEIDNERK